MTLNTEARGPALGYMYQISYALFLLLTADMNARIQIEKLDDIQLETGVPAKEALQLKHSIQSPPPNLTNKAVNLWKTIGNWCDLLQSGALNSVSYLTLVTVAKVSDSSTPKKLTVSPEHRWNNEEIQEELYKIAIEPEPSATLQPHLEKYRLLSKDQRLKLVARIFIIENAPHINDMAAKIKGRLPELPHLVDELYERVLGWWLERVYRHLLNANDSVSKIELNHKIKEIQERFYDDNLPLDFSDAEPPEEMIKNQNQLRFVQQLTVIEMNQATIEKALRDYYRAFQERSKWIDDKRVSIIELQRYERELIEYWEIYCDRMRRRMKNQLDLPEGKILFGQSVHDDLMIDAYVPVIRPRVTEGYIKRGSYQILAHGANEVEPRVWWHPDFVKRLQEILTPISVDGHEVTIVSTSEEPPSTLETSKLLSWRKRPVEVAHLFNPAFSAIVLYEAIDGFTSTKGNDAGMPYTLCLLALPILLDSSVREVFPRTSLTRLSTWIHEQPQICAHIQRNYEEFSQISHEAMRFGLNKKILQKLGRKFKTIPQKRLVSPKQSQVAAKDLTTIRKLANRLGKILGAANNEVSIYTQLGVKP